MKKIFLLAILFYSCMLNAEITVQEAYVREMPPGQPVTAAFMRLHNSGEQAVVLLGASSDSAEQVEIHAHRHANGMMRMEQIDSVNLPAGGDFIFQPGEHHLMLINMTRPLKEGDSVSLTLEFNQAEPLTIKVPVHNIMREHNHH